MINRGQKVDDLITLLQDHDPQIRNDAALQLADLQANQAVDDLFKAILKPDNFNYNGTLVYALQALDCSQKLKEVFSVLFYQDYEAKLMAHQILVNQIFEFVKADLIEIQQMWLDCLKHPEKCPDFNVIEVQEMLESDVEGYLGYII